jgi:hypothetical protein
VEQTRRLRATELSALLRDRRTVRASLMRTIIHLVSAHDSMRLSKVYPFGLAKSNNQLPRAQIVPNTPWNCGHSQPVMVSPFLCM